jgi:hypothetical protein
VRREQGRNWEEQRVARRKQAALDDDEEDPQPETLAADAEPQTLSRGF